MTRDWYRKSVDFVYLFFVTLLWLAFLGSGMDCLTGAAYWTKQGQLDADRKAGLRSEAAIGRRLEARELAEIEEIERRRLIRDINPLGTAPAICLISAGMLAILRRQQLDTAAIIRCIEFGGDPPGALWGEGAGPPCRPANEKLDRLLRREAETKGKGE